MIIKWVKGLVSKRNCGKTVTVKHDCNLVSTELISKLAMVKRFKSLHFEHLPLPITTAQLIPNFSEWSVVLYKSRNGAFEIGPKLQCLTFGS